MEKLGIELSLLSKFILACQSPRLADAAEQLGQTPAALTMALHRLEERLGLKLLARLGGRVDLLPSAFWLFRVGSQLLCLEERVRHAGVVPSARPIDLAVEVDLSFAIGRVSKALLRSYQEMIASRPEMRVDWRFSGLGEDDAGDPAGLAARNRTTETGRIRIFYGEAGYIPPGAFHLYDDPWIVVSNQGAGCAKSVRGGPLTLLRMRREVMHAIAGFAAKQGFADRLRFRDEEPAHLSEILRDFPQLHLLMPADLLPRRLGIAQYDRVPFEPAFTSSLYASVSGDGRGHSTAFLAAMKRHLSEERSVVFAPRLTTRQIHYFNLAAHTGSISAAARVANAAQSSISRHISQMEELVAAPLLERTEEGTTLAPAGVAVQALTADIEEQQGWIFRKAHDIAAHSEARVTIGTLPSSGHDSALTERIALAVTRIHERHPDWQLRIIESSNTSLHEQVRAGELDLAIVGMAHPQVARIPLGPTEPLSVIGNPAVNFGGRTVLGLEDACSLPLVLGRQHLSIHQAFAETVQERNLRLTVAVDVGSLALAIAMVRQAPLCTVLPASSVRQDLEAGNLVAIPIRQSELSGTLSMIFSADRELSDAERLIIREFVWAFKADRGASRLSQANGGI
jgi:DNA-binding transcriptional LysR family regulator